ncbi:hypothetical protein BCD67_12480 [Oscillatoriales cyanobacterium USR001]|nr:hypothetical protein BCD67_12480 [Oscillatoriales cyanobacterium USR001]
MAPQKLGKRLSKGRLGLLSKVKSCFATFPETANWQRVAEALKGIPSNLTKVQSAYWLLLHRSRAS